MPFVYIALKVNIFRKELKLNRKNEEIHLLNNLHRCGAFHVFSKHLDLLCKRNTLYMTSAFRQYVDADESIRKNVLKNELVIAIYDIISTSHVDFLADL